MASKTTDLSLELGAQLGRGSYGAVFKARPAGFKITNYEELVRVTQDCALKTSRPRHQHELIHEYNILKRLRGCANIVDVFGMGDNRKYGKVMVMERLYDTLQDRAKSMPHAQKTAVFVDYLKGLFTALQCLAEHNIVHTDLHWGNIMFDKNMNAPILIDFGLAQEINLARDELVKFPFQTKLLRGDVSHNWRRWHPPEQLISITPADTKPYIDPDSDSDPYSDTDSEDSSRIYYESIDCTAKYDVYSVAVEMIRFLHVHPLDPKLGFDDLMRMCILQTNNPNTKTFKQIEDAQLWINNETLRKHILVHDTEMDDSVHSYFTSDANGYRQLMLVMPTALGGLLKQCLMFEDIRYTAREALDKLYEFTARVTPARMTTGVASGSSGGATGGNPIRNAAASAPTPALIQTVRKGAKELSSRKGAAKRKPLVVTESAAEKKAKNLIELRF